MTVKGLATRVALALYPPHVRERYGEEIEDLLAASPRPWRDLADVARCGLDEQFATISPRAAARQAGRALWAAVLILFALPLFGCLLLFAPPLAAAVAAVGGYALGVRAWAWWLPPLGAVGFVLAVAMAPGIAEVLGGGLADKDARGFLMLGLAGTVGLVALAAGLRRRWWVVAVCVAGALVTMELSTIWYVSSCLTPAEAPRSHALAWYLSGMVPMTAMAFALAATFGATPCAAASLNGYTVNRRAGARTPEGLSCVDAGSAAGAGRASRRSRFWRSGLPD